MHIVFILQIVVATLMALGAAIDNHSIRTSGAIVFITIEIIDLIIWYRHCKGLRPWKSDLAVAELKRYKQALLYRNALLVFALSLAIAGHAQLILIMWIAVVLASLLYGLIGNMAGKRALRFSYGEWRINRRRNKL